MREQERFRKQLKESRKFFELRDHTLWRWYNPKINDEERLCYFLNIDTGEHYHRILVKADSFGCVPTSGVKDCIGLKKDCPGCWAHAIRLKWFKLRQNEELNLTKWLSVCGVQLRAVRRSNEVYLRAMTRYGLITMALGDQNDDDLLWKTIRSLTKLVKRISHKTPDEIREYIKHSRNPLVRFVKMPPDFKAAGQVDNDLF